MSDILDPAQRARWRQEANRAARHMKTNPKWPRQNGWMKVAFVFNDAIVTVPIHQDTVKNNKQSQLAEIIYETVVSAVSVKH